MIKLKKLLQELKDQTIYEGLIYSVPSDEFQDHMERWAVSKHKIKIKIVANKKIHLTILENLDEQNLGNLLKWINNLGWYISTFMIFKNTNTKWENFNLKTFMKLYKDDNKNITFEIEPKFDEGKPITFFDDTFYHVSPIKNEKKILKIGLVPKAKEKISSHPERVYLATKLVDAEALADIFSDIDKENQYTIFKVNMKLAKENNKAIRMFHDPDFSSGFYTLSNIPPQFLTIIKRIEV
jgi:hypothetical protein